MIQVYLTAFSLINLGADSDDCDSIAAEIVDLTREFLIVLLNICIPISMFWNVFRTVYENPWCAIGNYRTGNIEI